MVARASRLRNIQRSTLNPQTTATEMVALPKNIRSLRVVSERVIRVTRKNLQMMKMKERQAAQEIRRVARGFIPDVGIILGSGLSAVAQNIRAVAAIPYSKISGLPRGHIAGH